MSTPFVVPLINQPQTLTIALAGVTYQLRVIWNDINQAWTLDISDQAGKAILQGVPLVTGEDLLSPFAYLSFNGQLIAQTDFNPSAVPTLQNLGSTGNLYFVTGVPA